MDNLVSIKQINETNSKCICRINVSSRKLVLTNARLEPGVLLQVFSKLFIRWRFHRACSCQDDCGIYYASIQYFSTGVPRVVAARGSAETDRNCLRRNSQPQFYVVVAI